MTPEKPDGATSRRMRATRQRNTPAEVAIRTELHRRGLRFRLHCAVAPCIRSRPDIVFPRRRVAVFVDGCFWHCCPVHGTRPARNSSWWRAKLDANVERDRRTDAALQAAGWRVVRIWEHELPSEAADRIAAVVRRG